MMDEIDVARWRFKSRQPPWRLAQINGRIAFGWRLESLAASRDTGAWETEMQWTRQPRYFWMHRKATLADLFYLGVAWWKSHALDAALVAMAAVSAVVFFGRCLWLILQGVV